jgi:hypothetical protein
VVRQDISEWATFQRQNSSKHVKFDEATRLRQKLYIQVFCGVEERAGSAPECSMPGDPALHINAISQPLWHALNALIDEGVSHVALAFHGEVSHLELILMGVLFEGLFHRLLTVLNRR